MPAATLPPPAPPAAPPRAPVVIEDKVTVPSWVHDLESFRRWARSDEFPERGRFSFLDGDVWVDLSMEQLFTHNGVKTQYTIVLGGLAQAQKKGRFFSDGVLLTHPDANLAIQPDAMFVSFGSLESGRIRLLDGFRGGELEGSPAMTLEIIGATTHRRDTQILSELYWRAGVSEYWLVDARKGISFEILQWTNAGFRNTDVGDAWCRSDLFDRWFRLVEMTDARGNPDFELLVREAAP